MNINLTLARSKLKNIFSCLRDKYLTEKYPSAVKIEITSRCNLKCIMCFHNYFKRPNIDMSFEEFKRIVDNFHGLKKINFAGIGENLLNKDFIRMIRYAKLKKIFVEFFSNFYLIDKKIAEELIETGVDRIYISIDGATKETYEKIRIGSDFEKVINNVRNFFELKKEKNIHTPEIIFNYVVNKYNFREIIKFVELISFLTSKLKTVISFTSVFSITPREKLGKIKISYDSEILKNIIQIAVRKGAELGISIVHNYGLPKALISECNQYITPFIFVTGEVIPCCVSIGPNYEFEEILLDTYKQKLRNENMLKKGYDLFKEMSLGNVFNQSFKEIWRNKRYSDFRKMLHRGEIPHFCERCPFYKIGV